jgi:hypothetical protein
VDPSTAALNPTGTPSAVVNSTTCSIGTPSDPVTAAVREVTVYVPGAGSTVPGITWNVRRVLSPAPTSHTRSFPSEYTTRSPVPDPSGTAAAGFFFAPGDFRAPAAGEDFPFGSGPPSVSGAFADA